MAKVTYLGPSMATFSALAYYRLAALFGAPSLGQGEEILAPNNQEVLPFVLQHGGFGAIAMGTDAEGRIDGPVNSFVKLLSCFETTKDCPIAVIAATKIPLNFVLMVRPGVQKCEIKTVIAHPKSLGACRNIVSYLTSNGATRVIESDSNGKAAQDVATKPDLAWAAALGPRVAAEKYGLKVLEEKCEDRPAATTFFLLGPKNNVVAKGNRAAMVFRVNDGYGALVDVLQPFKDVKLNLRQIHSFHVGNERYDFFIEVECDMNEPERLSQAIERANPYMARHILFGPFPVV